MAKTSTAKAAASATTLLIATRKGLWTMTGDAKRAAWKLQGPQFLGHIVHHAVLDPRDGKTLLVAARTGHLGHTVMRSGNRGRTWTESNQRPPILQTGRLRSLSFCSYAGQDQRCRRYLSSINWLT